MKEIVKALAQMLLILTAFSVVALMVATAEYYLKRGRWRAECVVSAVAAVLMLVMLCLTCYYLHWTTLGLVAALAETLWTAVFGLLAVMFYEETKS